MKLTYLGTAAAEGWPALYCRCEGCQTARINKGRDIRTRSQALINDDLLIDFCPDTYLHVLSYGLNLDKVQNIIVTHSHDDHLFPNDLLYRTDGFCDNRAEHVIGVYGNDDSIKKVKDVANYNNSLDRLLGSISLNVIKPYEGHTVGRYTIYPMLANHKEGEDAYIYTVTDGDKTLLYGHDTGYLLPQTWDFIKNQGIKYDLVSLDCTHGKEDVVDNHMGINTCALVKDRLTLEGLVNEGCVFILNHFSHNCFYLSYDEIVKDASKHGFLVSYDTMSVDI